MNVAIAWWPPSSGGSQQAIRGNVKAFDDPDLYLGDDVRLLEKRAHEYDFVMIPFVHYDGDLSAYDDTHLHLQFGGYPAEAHIKETQRVVNRADSISVLDPSILTDFYYEHIDLPDVSVIPNPPNYELFDSSEFDTTEEFVFVPKIGSDQKNIDELNKIAKCTLTETIRAHYVGDDRITIPDNVVPMPKVPFTHMPNRYEKARVVLNPSSLDVLPNTAYEAFMSHRPYVCRPDAIGDVQSIPADALDPGEFGMSVSKWLDTHSDDLGAGSHFIAASTPDEFGDDIFDLMTNMNMWHNVTDAADDWIDAWNGWSWEDKGNTLLEQ